MKLDWYVISAAVCEPDQSSYPKLTMDAAHQEVTVCPTFVPHDQ